MSTRGQHNLRIAAVVNEYGSVDHDGGVLERDGGTDSVDKLAGGCVCCQGSLGDELEDKVGELLRRPDHSDDRLEYQYDSGQNKKTNQNICRMEKQKKRRYQKLYQQRFSAILATEVESNIRLLGRIQLKANTHSCWDVLLLYCCTVLDGTLRVPLLLLLWMMFDGGPLAFVCFCGGLLLHPPLTAVFISRFQWYGTVVATAAKVKRTTAVSAGALLRYDYLVIETSGVTDPESIIRALDKTFGKLTRARCARARDGVTYNKPALFSRKGGPGFLDAFRRLH